MFVKYSEGQIASVINSEEDLNEKQKKAFQETAPLFNSPSEDDRSANETKKQGR